MSYHVIIVEDDANMVFGLELNLAVNGYRTSVFRCGLSALAAIADQPPDLVILDLILPDMHGLDVLRALRARNDSARVLILSGVVDVEMRVQALESGADDYVMKPFDLRELLARVRRQLHRRPEPSQNETVRLVPERSELVAPGVRIRLRNRVPAAARTDGNAGRGAQPLGTARVGVGPAVRDRDQAA